MIEVLICAWLTVLVFLFWQRMQIRTGIFLLNPLLFSVACIVPTLLYLDVSYERYMGGAKYLDYLIEPSVVALGFPLYKQIKMIGQQWRGLLLLSGLAVFLSLTCCVLLARLLGFDEYLIRSIVTLSITTAIAMETTHAMGGLPSLAAVMVMLAGFTGSVLGLYWLRLFKIKNEKAIGFAIGGTAHALGTAAITRHSYQSSAYASTALILCAIFTAIVAPIYIPLLLSL